MVKLPSTRFNNCQDAINVAMFDNWVDYQIVIHISVIHDERKLKVVTELEDKILQLVETDLISKALERHEFIDMELNESVLQESSAKENKFQCTQYVSQRWCCSISAAENWCIVHFHGCKDEEKKVWVSCRRGRKLSSFLMLKELSLVASLILMWWDKNLVCRWTTKYCIGWDTYKGNASRNFIHSSCWHLNGFLVTLILLHMFWNNLLLLLLNLLEHDK